MKKVLFVFLMMVSPVLADSWWTVITNLDGSASSKYFTVNCLPPHTLKTNEYPENYAFPTNDIQYWKKSGNDWIAMTPAEQTNVDMVVQQSIADIAGSDVNMDALFKVMAHLNDQSIKNKDYAYITNYFKNAVSPSKAKKKKEQQNNK